MTIVTFGVGVLIGFCLFPIVFSLIGWFISWYLDYDDFSYLD